ncbi:MAG: DMT family transporter [Paracoccaceae bacterium]|nr:DMT family transporter [Paracoccaceae bacterium]
MSIFLGFMAALCWGVHDIIVRFVTQRIEIYTAICTVFFGSIIILLALIWATDASLDIKEGALMLPCLTGMTFAIASVALYNAFALGPVRIVAPIIGAYPILSVIWAVLQGAHVSFGQMLAVLTVIAGVGFVATMANNSDQQQGRSRAILWSVVACVAFSVCFAVGQAAAPLGNTLTLNLIIRSSALTVLLVIGILINKFQRLNISTLPSLGLLASLDTLAFALVTSAGHYPDPQYASVAASIFGMVTIILAWIFLKERLTGQQWLAVSVVFGAILYLGL